MVGPMILIGGTLILLAIILYYVPVALWFSVLVSGVHVSLLQLFLMRIRNVPCKVIVQALIEAHKAGIKNLSFGMAIEVSIPASIAPNARDVKATALYSNEDEWVVGYLGLTMGTDIGLFWNTYPINYNNGKLSFWATYLLSVNSNYISTIFMTY